MPALQKFSSSTGLYYIEFSQDCLLVSPEVLSELSGPISDKQLACAH
jgi:hypothetical protein